MKKPRQRDFIDDIVRTLNHYAIMMMAESSPADIDGLQRKSARAAANCYKAFAAVEKDGRYELIAMLSQAHDKTLNPIAKGIAKEFIKDAQRGRNFTRAYEQCWQSLKDEPGI